jgi:trehalose 6-phosphate synthase
MNLVAKEYVSAQDPENPGVLVLSQFAGAAAELPGALIVNPHEVEGLAAAIGKALEMPLEERRERHAPMLAYLLEHDVERWSEGFLSALGETRQRPGLLESLRAMFGPLSP